MNTRLLCYPDLNLSPEARWLLLQWSRAEGLEQALTCSLKDLYQCLGTTARQGKPVLERLKKHGYLIYEPVRHGRGRPLSSHRIALGFRNRLDETPPPDTPHQTVIEALCSHAMACRASTQEKASNLMTGEDRAKKLAPATYWLLAVLLAYAETPGIVRGLSYGHLQAVTGMTRERLKSQLSKLKKLGVIARHQPGMLLSKEDVRMRSVYFLDLTHPLLLGEDSLGLTVEYAFDKGPGKENFISSFYEAALVLVDLYNNADDISERIQEVCTTVDGKEKPVGENNPRSLRSLYSDAYTELYNAAVSLLPPRKYVDEARGDLVRIRKLGMGCILKSHIYSYALMLLSHHWKDVEYKRGGVSDPIEELMKIIKVDCAYLIGVDDSDGGSRLNGPLLECIYALAHHLAVNLQYTLKLIEKRDGSDYRFSDAIFSLDLVKGEGGKCWKIKSHFLPSDGVFCVRSVKCNDLSVSLRLPEGLDLFAEEKG